MVSKHQPFADTTHTHTTVVGGWGGSSSIVSYNRGGPLPGRSTSRHVIITGAVAHTFTPTDNGGARKLACVWDCCEEEAAAALTTVPQSHLLALFTSACFLALLTRTGLTPPSSQPNQSRGLNSIYVGVRESFTISPAAVRRPASLPGGL